MAPVPEELQVRLGCLHVSRGKSIDELVKPLSMDISDHGRAGLLLAGLHRRLDFGGLDLRVDLLVILLVDLLGRRNVPGGTLDRVDPMRG
jgi:hypothetical protein